MTYDRVCEKSSMQALIFFDRKLVGLSIARQVTPLLA